MTRMLIAMIHVLVSVTSVLCIALGLALAMGAGAALLAESGVFDPLLAATISM